MIERYKYEFKLRLHDEKMVSHNSDAAEIQKFLNTADPLDLLFQDSALQQCFLCLETIFCGDRSQPLTLSVLSEQVELRPDQESHDGWQDRQCP